MCGTILKIQFNCKKLNMNFSHHEVLFLRWFILKVLNSVYFKTVRDKNVKVIVIRFK